MEKLFFTLKLVAALTCIGVLSLVQSLYITHKYNVKRTLNTQDAEDSSSLQLQKDLTLSDLPNMDWQNGTTKGRPQLWINVEDFGEGISGWKESVLQLLLTSLHVNATFVEPCMRNGRLGSCRPMEDNNSTIAKIPISQIFDFSNLPTHLMQSYRTFQDLQRHPSTNVHSFRMCATATKYAERACNNATNRGQKIECKPKDTKCLKRRKEFPELIAAMAKVDALSSLPYSSNQTDIVILTIENYWTTAMTNSNILVGDRTYAIGPESPSEQVAFNQKHFRFHPQHVDTVHSMLHQSNLLNHTLFVVHWRAEHPDMDYRECAQQVVNVISHANNNTKTNSSMKMVLMSSIQANPSNMWSGARKMADATAQDSLHWLKEEHGMIQISDYSPTGVPDFGLLGVYDLILASEAQKFATCSNRKRECSCHKCNHVGQFANLAAALRTEQGKSTYDCWME